VTMRRKGFTLIELLVVIAIIGILAAMLFPVFARARESARKTQCLANVKNLAIAVNMYAADWDRMFPSETRREVIDYFSGMSGKGAVKTTWPEICNHVNHANPYVRAAVVLEDYVKSKDVYKCPSARMMNGAAFIVSMGPGGDWVQSYRDHESEWGRLGGSDYGPCYVAYPTGWGGDITDSLIQHAMASTTGGSNVAGAGNDVFVQGIGFNTSLVNLNLAAVNDAARYIALGDTGAQADPWETERLAYPDYCGSNNCGGTSCPETCTWADWDNCSWTQNCGFDPNNDTPNSHQRFLTDSTQRKSRTRHMGGSNVGFMDGHAKWYLADALCTQAEPFKDPFFEGMCSCWPGNGVM
jgi:prepilin-type N-terminal cleavage/methylation domain-containing protein/prepilin-type processing-associated H-X9-DG protein